MFKKEEGHGRRKEERKEGKSKKVQIIILLVPVISLKREIHVNIV